MVVHSYELRVWPLYGRILVQCIFSSVEYFDLVPCVLCFL